MIVMDIYSLDYDDTRLLGCFTSTFSIILTSQSKSVNIELSQLLNVTLNSKIFSKWTIGSPDEITESNHFGPKGISLCQKDMPK